MREEETKRLKRLVHGVKSAPDTPAIISILAEDRELLALTFRILTIQPAADPALFEDLDRICREAEATPALLKKRLTPAARALGLPGPEETTGDFYKVLGVSHGASLTEVRKAYLLRARDLHPDIHPDIRPQEFVLLAEAYRVLSSPDLREAYDASQRKVDPDWAERSPLFMEEAEKQTEGHQRRRRGLVVQLGLVLLAMIIGIGVASYLFEQQALREGPSYVQTPSDIKGPATVPETRPSPAVQLAANLRQPVPESERQGAGSRGHESGVRSQESRLRGQKSGVRSQESAGRESGSGRKGKGETRKPAEPVVEAAAPTEEKKPEPPIETPAVSKGQGQAQKTAGLSEMPTKKQGPTPHGPKAPEPLEPTLKPRPDSETRASAGETPALSDRPSPPSRPKAGSTEKDERLPETEILAELNEMALKASQPAQAPARPEPIESRPADPVPVKQTTKSVEPPKAHQPSPAVEQPAQPVDRPPREPLDPSSRAKAPNRPEPTVASSAPVQEPARPEPIETRPIEPIPVKPAGKPVEPPSVIQPAVEAPRMAQQPVQQTQAVEKPVKPPSVPRREIQDFLKAYCRAYENLNYSRFMGYFAPDAVENNQSVHQLEATYRENFERLDALTYDIRVKDCRVKPDEIEVTGDYRLRWRFREDDWREREGPIVLGLIPVNASFQVKRLIYR